ncbi:hypothetical protein AB0I77_12325 [Streptomyces sp. NPDC050619]|uniref:hypothetical protein n=1 Tax=Streptomyces sp. NPDC050619 TaxID=3157214 RepID=UPI003449FA27
MNTVMVGSGRDGSSGSGVRRQLGAGKGQVTAPEITAPPQDGRLALSYGAPPGHGGRAETGAGDLRSRGAGSPRGWWGCGLRLAW